MLQGTEADARMVIDRLLREASWDIEDKSQVLTEESTAGYAQRDNLFRRLHR